MYSWDRATYWRLSTRWNTTVISIVIQYLLHSKPKSTRRYNLPFRCNNKRDFHSKLVRKCRYYAYTGIALYCDKRIVVVRDRSLRIIFARRVLTTKRTRSSRRNTYERCIIFRVRSALIPAQIMAMGFRDYYKGCRVRRRILPETIIYHCVPRVGKFLSGVMATRRGARVILPSNIWIFRGKIQFFRKKIR